MTYVNQAGHVSVPEKLWGEILGLLGEYQSEIECSGVNLTILERARALDARHRQLMNRAAQSTRDQIERGGSGRPYGE